MKQILEARETQEEQFPWGQTSKQVDIQDQSLLCHSNSSIINFLIHEKYQLCPLSSVWQNPLLPSMCTVCFSFTRQNRYFHVGQPPAKMEIIQRMQKLVSCLQQTPMT